MRTLIIATALLFTSISSFAQGGGSVNGPDLKGNMIPVYSDGEIPAEKLNSALDICYRRTFEQILSAAHGKSITLGKFYSPVDVAYVDENQEPAPIPSTEKTPSSIGGQVQQSEYLSFSMTYPKCEGSDKSWDHCYDNGRNFIGEFYKGAINQAITLKGYFLPFISYELKDKSIFGELGEVIEKKVFVSNIHYNFKPGTNATVYTLYSVRTDGQTVPTPLKIDIMDLIQCVKTNLVK